MDDLRSLSAAKLARETAEQAIVALAHITQSAPSDT